MDKDKWKKFYKEKDEEVDSLRLDIDKAKKALEFRQKIGSKKPVKPYQPIISKEDDDYLGIFWERRQAAASIRNSAQNNILDPVQLSNATADVIRNDATLYTRTYLDATKSIKNQTGVCKTTYLPNILHKLEEDYSSVLCLGKTDWMARIFVTGVLRNRRGSAYNYDDEDDSADDKDGGWIAKRGMKRKERRNGVERLHADQGEHLSLLGHKWGQRGPGLEESSASIGTVARLVEKTMSRKRYRPMANLLNDPLREKRARQNKLLENQNSSVSMPDSIYQRPSTKRLLIAVTSAECDINLPIDADDDKYSSEDLWNNPQGNMLGHNSLGEEMQFCLKKWENVGSRDAIAKLLQAVGGWLRVTKALKNSMAPGKYSNRCMESHSTVQILLWAPPRPLKPKNI
ncbi:hypothetical protein BT69DRAFT_1306605 [Atractiella rhizophila]|nr:hypothetical protein BT69DRAFT_1306605 [Atractiella rhizophila]